MATGKTSSQKIVVNNMPNVTVTKTVELVVVNNSLVPDHNDIHPGVNSTFLKN